MIGNFISLSQLGCDPLKVQIKNEYNYYYSCVELETPTNRLISSVTCTLSVET